MTPLKYTSSTYTGYKRNKQEKLSTSWYFCLLCCKIQDMRGTLTYAQQDDTTHPNILATFHGIRRHGSAEQSPGEGGVTTDLGSKARRTIVAGGFGELGEPGLTSASWVACQNSLVTSQPLSWGRTWDLVSERVDREVEARRRGRSLGGWVAPNPSRSMVATLYRVDGVMVHLHGEESKWMLGTCDKQVCGRWIILPVQRYRLDWWNLWHEFGFPEWKLIRYWLK